MIRNTKKLQMRVKEVCARLDKELAEQTETYLDYGTPFQLLVATILSAQCTDARVNMVTPALFKKYPDAKRLAKADIKDVEALVHSTGFYHHKARNIIACADAIVERFHGEVPETIEELTSLPGVGRKTANVVRGNIYKQDSVVVDTHVKRISYRLGFTNETDPVKVEYDLMKVLPKENWIRYNLQIIHLGRTICTSQRPKCSRCFLADICPSVVK
ncbi:MAG: endonuclease III [Lachnospiraceae bacterium]|nr:endonuclease III [Lachnospiraceae bacterium]